MSHSYYCQLDRLGALSEKLSQLERLRAGEVMTDRDLVAILAEMRTLLQDALYAHRGTHSMNCAFPGVINVAWTGTNKSDDL